MKISILKRIEALESQVVKVESPDLIMIHYNEFKNKWMIDEYFSNGKQARAEEILLDRLQEYCFKAAYHSRVILDTFSSPDESIMQNLFAFDIDELRAELKPTDTGAFFIEAIKHDNSSKIPQSVFEIKAIQSM